MGDAKDGDGPIRPVVPAEAATVPPGASRPCLACAAGVRTIHGQCPDPNCPTRGGDGDA